MDAHRVILGVVAPSRERTMTIGNMMVHLMNSLKETPTFRITHCDHAGTFFVKDTRTGAEFSVQVKRADGELELQHQPCCANERRTMDGGCANCGDPCF